ncbi:MAG: FAD:protein FMN transferase [Bacteroidota bacterium]
MQVYHNSSFSMGTRFNLLLPGIEKPGGAMLYASVMYELNRIENMLSCFMPDSEISRINENAYSRPVEINDELFYVLTECLRYSELTEGAFDISLGKIIDHWSEKDVKTDIKVLTEGCGADKILLDPSDKTVRFTSPHVKINLGGYGKGYALENVQRLLKEKAISSAFISFGESSLSCLGKHPHGEYWPVGIRDHYQKDKSIAALKLLNSSVSTSGNMENNNHLINPTKGSPVDEKMHVSVKSRSAIIAEVLSTALCVADKSSWKNIQIVFPGIEILRVVYRAGKADVLSF